MNPLIGITIYSEISEHNTLGSNTWVNITDPYIKCINQLGGIPIVIPMVGHYKMSNDIIDKLDGAIMIGDTKLEIQHSFDTCAYEQEFCEMLLGSDIPILGIGRGLKLINKILGGDCAEDILDDTQDGMYILQDTKLSRILEDNCIDTSMQKSLRISRLGRDLRINAVSNKDAIEGIEGTTDRFLMGVEWHPELFMYLERLGNIHSKRIFEYFVNESLKYKTSKG